MRTSLYRFYDAEGRLLYIGVTSMGPNRWRDHEASRAWWNLVASSTVEHYPDRASAMAAERAAIKAEHPAHNVRHNGPTHREARPLMMRRHGEGTICVRADGHWTFAASTEQGRFSTTVASEAEARLLLAVYQGRGVRPRIRALALDILEAGADWRKIA